MSAAGGADLMVASGRTPTRPFRVILVVSSFVAVLLFVLGCLWERGWYDTRTGELRFETTLALRCPWNDWDDLLPILTTRDETLPTAVSNYIAATSSDQNDGAGGQWRQFLGNEAGLFGRRVNFGSTPDIIFDDDLFEILREQCEPIMGREVFTRFLREYLKPAGQAQVETVLEALLDTRFKAIATPEGRSEFILEALRSREWE